MTALLEVCRLSAARLRDVLDYDSVSGVFRWRITSGRAITGRVAGRLKGGYRYIKIDEQEYRAHRLAWLYITGNWPKNQIDHRNQSGIKDDNRFINLREATNAQNQSYRVSAARNSKTGLRGVHSHRGKFYAQIMRDGKSHWLGYFPTPEEAHTAYLVAKNSLFGDAA